MITDSDIHPPQFSLRHILLRNVASFISNAPSKLTLKMARAVLDQLVEDRLDDIFSVLSLGYVEAELGNNDNARACFLFVFSQEGAISLAQYDLACFNLGFLAEQANDVPDALHYFKRSVAVNPKNGRSWFGLGRVYEKTAEIEKANAAYEKVVEGAPEHEGGWYELALFCRRHQKEDRLKEILLYLRGRFPKTSSKLAHELEKLDRLAIKQ